MSYKQKTIINIIEDINSKKILLPPIQRKYVWDENQIVKLMDSIMRGYPFGTFLFWQIKKAVINEKDYPMYEFIKDYHERDVFENPRTAQPFSLTAENIDDTIYAVLDGQQRLASLYIALGGSLSKKISKKRYSDSNAFPKKELYFNLLSKKQNEDEEIQYEFKFLDIEKPKEQEDDIIWYRVKDILKYPNVRALKKDIRKEKAWRGNKLIVNNLIKVFECLKVDKLIYYFEVCDDSVGNILDIFVRVNSGGTVLSKTDLLFSTIVAYWQGAREQIDKFLKEINNTKRYFFHYDFNNDFIMRACLYVLEMPITMTVESFKQENINLIKEKWKDIKGAIKDTTELLCELGFGSENIVSNNAILPIIYYRYKVGKNAFSSSNTKNAIKKYFVISQVKKIFGNHSNQTLDILRNVLRDKKSFCYEELQNIELADNRTLVCTDADIDEWVDGFKKGPYTFLLLSLLYPDKNYNDTIFEQDHMHPYSGFSQSNLKKIIPNGSNVSLSSAEIIDWIAKRDALPNLELLTDKENEEKGNKELKEWLLTSHTDRYLPKNNDDCEFYDFCNFINFYNGRKELIKKELKTILVK